MTLRILVVCTANVCRSPVAERLLAQRLETKGIDAEVRSAGTHGGHHRVHKDTIRAAREVDVGLTDHESRRLSAELIEHDGADLVITMTREHLREVVAMAPQAWPRTFTLKELVRRGSGVGISDGAIADWLSAAGADRRAADLMMPSVDDDLIDPYGGPYQGHVAMVHEVNDLTTRLAGLIPNG